MVLCSSTLVEGRVGQVGNQQDSNANREGLSKDSFVGYWKM